MCIAAQACPLVSRAGHTQPRVAGTTRESCRRIGRKNFAFTRERKKVAGKEGRRTTHYTHCNAAMVCCGYRQMLMPSMLLSSSPSVLLLMTPLPAKSKRAVPVLERMRNGHATLHPEIASTEADFPQVGQGAQDRHQPLRSLGPQVVVT